MAFTQPAAAQFPAPTPPAWQRDLDAARVLQTALAFAPDADPAKEANRREHLGNLYGQLVARYPDRAEVQKATADYYARAGQSDLAVACWQRAEILDPNDGETAEALGSAFLQRGRVRDARDQFERAVKAQPDMPAYHFDLANVLYLFRHELAPSPGVPDEQHTLSLALEHFRRAAELAPGDLRLAQAYAETFYLIPKPDWQQALSAWQSVLTLSGENTDFANGHLARVSLRLGRSADVESYLDRIHSPAFDAMKVKFRQQAATIRADQNSSPAPLDTRSPPLGGSKSQPVQ